jgi:hypothetical protein
MQPEGTEILLIIFSSYIVQGICCSLQFIFCTCHDHMIIRKYVNIAQWRRNVSNRTEGIISTSRKL